MSTFLPLFSFSFLFLVSKGKLAASFSLLKVLFKLETLQTPHPPLPFAFPHSLSYLFLLAEGDSHLSSLTASWVLSTLDNSVL